LGRGIFSLKALLLLQFETSEIKKMKVQKKRLSAAIAIALTLIIAATFISTLPVAFSQVKIPMTARIGVPGDVPYYRGVNQTVRIQGLTFPPPGYSVDHTYKITKPDRTFDVIVNASDELAESWIEYTPDQVGTYTVKISWAGDATHTSCSASTSWDVLSEEMPPLEKVELYAYVSATPTTVGLGQSAFIGGYLTPPRELTSCVYRDVTLTVTKPSGATIVETKHSDAPATRNMKVVCDQLGTWEVVLSYDGDWLHTAACSPPFNWTVQEEPVPPYPNEPLPTGPWTYPILGTYWEWYQISGPWLGFQGTYNIPYNASGTSFNPYTRAPNSAHILWRLQTDTGGIMGGDTGYLSWEGSGVRAVAAQGRLYWTTSESTTLDGENVGTHPVLWCYDQYTGELIYRRDLPGPGGGSNMLVFEIGTYEGEVDPTLEERAPSAFSLWISGGSLWEVNPWTGDVLYQWPGGPNGWLVDHYLYFSGFNGTSGKSQSGVMTKWDCRAKETVWVANGSITYIWNDLIVVPNRPTGGVPQGNTLAVYNTTTGEQLVYEDYPFYTPTTWGVVAYGKVIRHAFDRKVYALDVYTGKIAWESEPQDYPWGALGMYWGAAAYGNFYIGSYDGHLYCYNGTTGKTEWKFYCGDNPDNAMGHNVPWSGAYIGGDRVYVLTSEHSIPVPFPRTNKLICIDAHTGDLIWEMNGFTGRSRAVDGGISSGMLWINNLYDASLYMFGKGESKTTVSAPTTVVPLGNDVLIQGTVTDQSPGSKGTPAISDASMSQWMEYLYMQKPMPTNATGVTVFLQAMRSDGSVMDITHVTSDIMGHYEYTWTPPDQDTYKILATFEGSDSYWTSSGECGLSVSPAPAATAPPQAAPDNTPMFIASTAAVIIAIAIVGVLLLRKRP
jgi:outer membrane protein assembly factor BamB